MGVARLFGLCVALLFASTVTQAVTIDVGPSDWRKYGPAASHTPSGVQSTFSQNVRMPPTVSGPTRVLPVARNAVIPYGSIANGIRTVTRVNPASIAASAAITALFLGLDWAFDEELDSWVQKTSIELSDPLYGGFTAGAPYVSGQTFPSAVDACTAAINANFSGYSNFRAELTPQGYYDCYATTRGGSDRQLYAASQVRDCPAPYRLNEEGGFCYRTGVIELAPTDWERLDTSLPNSDPQLVADSARDVQRQMGAPLPGYTDNAMSGPSSLQSPSTTTTSTNPATGDTTVTESSTTTDLTYGDTTITAVETTTSTTYENGIETGSSITTETGGDYVVDQAPGGGGTVPPWPAFCEWAGVVCDWLNWTREDPPPEEDLPAVIDDDFYEEKRISFGAKSCPEPYQVNLAPFMDTQVAVSFQPLCDFAGLIYYMVMAASYIIAAYISIGVARA